MDLNSSEDKPHDKAISENKEDEFPSPQQNECIIESCVTNVEDSTDIEVDSKTTKIEEYVSNSDNLDERDGSEQEINHFDQVISVVAENSQNEDTDSSQIQAPRNTPVNDGSIEEQAAAVIEQVIAAASAKVGIDLPEKITDNICQMGNKGQQTEKLS